MKVIGLLVLSAVLLSSCTVLPAYRGDGAAIARLNMAALQDGWICAGGKRYQLQADASGYAPVPAGQRVTVGRAFYAQGYNVSYRCNSAISFVPEAGASYYGNFELAAERCRVEIYREQQSSRTGLAFDATLGRPEYCSS